MTFNNLKELTEFVGGLEGKTANVVNTTAKVELASTVAKEEVVVEAAAPALTPAQKAAITRKANAAKKKADAAAQAALQVTAPINVADTAASVMQVAPVAAPAPMVQCEAPAAAVVAPVIDAAASFIESNVDTAAFIAEATSLIARMKATGLKDEDLIPQLTTVFNSVGVAFGQISLLPDNELVLVVNAMGPFVANLEAGATVPAQTYV